MEKGHQSYLDHIKEVFPFGITQVNKHDGGDDFFETVMKQYAGEKDVGLLKRSKLRLLARPLFTAGYIFANGLKDQYASHLTHIEDAFA
jgi:hypothetical protein